jgi:hypothetical protein
MDRQAAEHRLGGGAHAHVHAAEMRSLGEAFGQAITRDL